MSREDEHDHPPGHGHDAECGAVHVHMTCQKLVSLLTEYVEGDIAAPEKTALEDHLGFCPPCVGFLSEYRRASTACREALLERVPSDLEQRLLSFLRGKVTG